MIWPWTFSRPKSYSESELKHLTLFRAVEITRRRGSGRKGMLGTWTFSFHVRCRGRSLADVQDALGLVRWLLFWVTQKLVAAGTAYESKASPPNPVRLNHTETASQSQQDKIAFRRLQCSPWKQQTVRSAFLPREGARLSHSYLKGSATHMSFLLSVTENILQLTLNQVMFSPWQNHRGGDRVGTVWASRSLNRISEWA